MYKSFVMHNWRAFVQFYVREWDWFSSPLQRLLCQKTPWSQSSHLPGTLWSDAQLLHPGRSQVTSGCTLFFCSSRHPVATKPYQKIKYRSAFNSLENWTDKRGAPMQYICNSYLIQRLKDVSDFLPDGTTFFPQDLKKLTALLIQTSKEPCL